MRIALILAAVALLAAPLRAGARWTLDCQAGRVGTVTVNGTEGPGTYGWMTIVVTNNSGKEAPLSLGVGADSDVAGRKYRGGNDPVVRAAVERIAGKAYKTLDEARGKLADKESAEIFISFGKLDPSVDTLDVSVLGLVDRVYRDKGHTYLEDRALHFMLARPGDEFERQNDVVKVVGRAWKPVADAKETRKG